MVLARLSASVLTTMLPVWIAIEKVCARLLTTMLPMQQIVLEKVFARFLTILPFWIAQRTTLDRSTRLGHWYAHNGIYKFPKNTAIAVMKRCCLGYGLRPIGIVKGYTDFGGYVIHMYCDTDANVFAWLNGTYVPSGDRSVKKAEYLKWDIEQYFEKVARIDPALIYE